MGISPDSGAMLLNPKKPDVDDHYVTTGVEKSSAQLHSWWNGKVVSETTRKIGTVCILSFVRVLGLVLNSHADNDTDD